MDAQQALAIVRLRLQHPKWGAKKLHSLLRSNGNQTLPSLSTINRVLQHSGLVVPNKRGRSRRWTPGDRIGAITASNDLWTVDFKGWWRTRDGSRCEPLTTRDAFSRYVLVNRPLDHNSGAAVRAVFEELFRKYGLPKAIKSDNGSLFASTVSPGGLTQLGAWWKALGIRLVRSRPGHPQDNGGHERMHLDLAQDLEGTPAANLAEQQQICERWRLEFNSVRPHQALGQKTPAKIYRPSSRRYDSKRPEVTYPSTYAVRTVKNGGEISRRGQMRFISEALAGRRLGIQFLDSDRIRLWFCDLCLGETDDAFRSPLGPTASATIETGEP